MSDKEKRRILIVLSALIIALIALIIYLTYFQFFLGEEYRTSSRNRRNAIEAEKITRGAIYDKDGEVLAYTDESGENDQRIYTHPNLYSHIIGYDYDELGKSGLELHMNYYLTNTFSSGIKERVENFINKDYKGASLNLTINTEAQEMASDLLGDNKGAIVALEPDTGRVIAMVSKPDYDPNSAKANWEEINADNDSPLFNRAINGLYPPGSVMKIVSAASILESDVDLNYDHTGTQVIDGYEYSDATSAVYGNIGMETAFAKSLNTYFVTKIQGAGREGYENTAQRFMFEKKVDFELPISVSSLNLDKNYDKNLLAASSIGQGQVLVTPMQMALVSAAVANDGVMYKPYIVESIVKDDGSIVEERSPQVLIESISEDLSEELNDLMVATTNKGTGSKAALNKVQVAGKTGTAENATGVSHAWYVGYAPADEPEVAIAVIVEGGTSGGTVAAPIAREMIKTILDLDY